MDPVANGLVVSAFALAVIVPIDVWVYFDARARERRSRPVTLEVGAVRIDRPAQWIAGCVILFVLFVPAYVVARDAP